jgi:hypothetical protein
MKIQLIRRYKPLETNIIMGYRKTYQIANSMRKTARNDRKSMLSGSGHRCERCGMSIRGMPSSIVHKNADASDNKKSNVMIVCIDCYNEINGKPALQKQASRPMNRSESQISDNHTPTNQKPAREELKKEKKSPWWKFWQIVQQ